MTRTELQTRSGHCCATFKPVGALELKCSHGFPLRRGEWRAAARRAAKSAHAAHSGGLAAVRAAGGEMWSKPRLLPDGVWLVRTTGISHAHLVLLDGAPDRAERDAVCGWLVGPEWCYVQRLVPLPAWLSLCPVCIGTPTLPLDTVLRIAEGLASQTPVSVDCLAEVADATAVIPAAA